MLFEKLQTVFKVCLVLLIIKLIKEKILLLISRQKVIKELVQ